MSTIVEGPPESNASQWTRNLKNQWPNSRSNSAAIRRASRRRRQAKDGPFDKVKNAKRRRILTSFSLFFPLAEAVTEDRQSLGALVFMATEQLLREQEGEKKAKGKRKKAIVSRRRQVRSGEQVTR